MKTQLTPTERTICSIAGATAHIEGDTIDVNSYQANIICRRIEELIERQESDQGCWLTAKEWRAAKSGLINKLRKVIITGVE